MLVGVTWNACSYSLWTNALRHKIYATKQKCHCWMSAFVMACIPGPTCRSELLSICLQGPWCLLVWYFMLKHTPTTSPRSIALQPKPKVDRVLCCTRFFAASRAAMAAASSCETALLLLLAFALSGCPLRLVTPPELDPIPFAPPILPAVGIL